MSMGAIAWLKVLEEARLSESDLTVICKPLVVESELLAGGHTVIVVSHRLGHLAECARPASDVVVRVRDGTLEGVWSDVRELVVNGDGELRGQARYRLEWPYFSLYPHE
ncbi:hypothetical protein MYCTH_2111394 [Thermothelomyces thermophilus ATCC 42464]|uniref:Uncharacterized protein n=1 Tax=Thermothelomyces thermophilus (strain ATCC 42464 / BCRC 31852 / DSM 1799) TaxID=573729 RepID=G2QFD5_THET4|nr:uncharacterized protein MYCTH_2111394 [Thermothelomyces thermophilus ATCC 42464]AEO59164.1 hypothetical protein MYCTH_2111394 [Thermothelomyces thermophilus ATCC 42464]